MRNIKEFISQTDDQRKQGKTLLETLVDHSIKESYRQLNTLSLPSIDVDQVEKVLKSDIEVGSSYTTKGKYSLSFFDLSTKDLAFSTLTSLAATYAFVSVTLHFGLGSSGIVFKPEAIASGVVAILTAIHAGASIFELYQRATSNLRKE